jgi:thioesterase domain-containing protein
VTGDTASYRKLENLLGPDVRLFGIQVSGRQMNAAFASSIESLACHHVEALVNFQPTGPLVIGGWSVGAIVALEMARQLRAIGRDVPLLVALDGAPCNTGAGISPRNPLYAWRLACNLPGWIKGKGASPNGFSWKTLVKGINSSFVFQLGLTAPRLRSEQTLQGDVVQTILESAGWSNNQRAFIRALYDASRAYVPQPYPGRVLAYEAKVQPLNHLRQVGPAWKAIAASLDIVQLRSTHLGMFEEPAIRVFSHHLRATLAALRQGQP